MPLPESQAIPRAPLPHMRLCMIGLIDVLGNMLCLIGLIMVGSGVRNLSAFLCFARWVGLKFVFQTYQVIYSSVVLFTAFFARIFLGKVLSLHQMIALVVVSGGLTLSALGSASSASPGDELSTSTLLFGCFITLIGSMCYGLVYASAEGVLSLPEAPHPIQVQTMAGIWGFGAVSLYFMFHTLPNVRSRPAISRGRALSLVCVFSFKPLSWILSAREEEIRIFCSSLIASSRGRRFCTLWLILSSLPPRAL